MIFYFILIPMKAWDLFLSLLSSFYKYIIF